MIPPRLPCEAAFAFRKSSFTVLMWFPWNSSFCRPQRIAGMQIDGLPTCLLNIWSGGYVWAGCRMNFCLLSRGSSSPVSHLDSSFTSFSDYTFFPWTVLLCHYDRKCVCLNTMKNFKWSVMWRKIQYEGFWPVTSFIWNNSPFWSPALSDWKVQYYVLLCLVAHFIGPHPYLHTYCGLVQFLLTKFSLHKKISFSLSHRAQNCHLRL